MHTCQIGHVAFICKDLPTSIAFYRDQLGFTNKFVITYGDWLNHHLEQSKEAGVSPNPDMVARLTPKQDKTWIAYFEMGGGQFVELFDADGAHILCPPTPETLNYSHVALLVEDIHQAHEELKAKGVPIDTPPSLGLEGTWQMWTHDPDGNRIEYMQYTEKSWQLTGHP